ncbi:hypothetical protein [Kibdelosporangium phytohabitans]|uniref:Uncharacterized protein n=1 Tax=Kibdelosporangium phytohabitans TaxID=860235 RepID=A0A0N9I5G9_9PSEU|nr:hypothetical protein [Kibdelosporangium phytohabitans]ALG14069.1 hypothetical protein AOZ06_50800 [Kibdelosporangium phytohabitans]MBE1466961.1 uncharacterized membrane protein (UPF0136 family) [Kibdelosporangium phytohabitans]
MTSFQPGIVDNGLRRRLVRSRVLFWAAFAGLPLVLAVLAILLTYQPEALGVHERMAGSRSSGRAILFVLLVVVSGTVGWLIRRRPRVWVTAASFVGLAVGMIFGLVASLATRQTQNTVMASFIGTTVCCALVALWARRVLLNPLTPDLAGTALHVPVWLRDNVTVCLVIGHDALVLRRTSKAAPFSVEHGFSQVQGVEVGHFPADARIPVMLGDPEGEDTPAKVADLRVDAGPTLRVRFPDHVMEIPVKEPDALAELLRRRVERARGRSTTGLQDG